MATHTYDTTSVEATNLPVALPPAIVSSGVEVDREIKANSDIIMSLRHKLILFLTST
jgi:hypothetical protein